MSKFSVIIPTHNRAEKLFRAIKSVLSQTHKDFEIIVIDDGSQDDTFDIIKRLQAAGRDKVPLTYIRHVRQQRLIARNKGMKVAMNDWIVMIDDDDEILPDYLEEFNRYINAQPEFSVFQCAAQFYKLIDEKEVKLRMLPPLNFNGLKSSPHTESWHANPYFVSGHITMGQFIFNKKCLEKTGYFPHTHTYGDFAVQSGIPGYGWIDPQPPRFPERRVQVLGNPFGDDYWLFYKLTRYFKVGSTDKVLLKKWCR